jgi:N-acetylmuramoyl-L-alanine amidase
MTSIAAPIFATSAEPLTRADSHVVSDIRPSPNHGERRGAYGLGKKPDVLLLHYTGMPAGRGMNACERAVRWLTTEESQVSCHYVVDEDGRVLQLVAEDRRAWHAGVGAWKGETDINSASIGIEIVNPGHFWDMSAAAFSDRSGTPEVHPGYAEFPDGQIEAVIALARDIVARNRIPAENVIAHSDIAPSRKSDPGEKFPWNRLATAGLGLWVEPAGPSEGPSLKSGDEGQPVRAIQSMLALLGYQIALTGVFDTGTIAIVTAFQRHWRPSRVDGVADRSTIMTLHALVQKLQAKEERP